MYKRQDISAFIEYGKPLLHLLDSLLYVVPPVFFFTVPLIYDVFRSPKVVVYVYVVAAGTALLFLYPVLLGGFYAPVIAFILIPLAVLMVLFSTRWSRFIRAFYGTVSTLAALFLFYMALSFTLGYGVNPCLLYTSPSPRD